MYTFGKIKECLKIIKIERRLHKRKDAAVETISLPELEPIPSSIQN